MRKGTSSSPSNCAEQFVRRVNDADPGSKTVERKRIGRWQVRLGLQQGTVGKQYEFLTVFGPGRQLAQTLAGNSPQRSDNNLAASNLGSAALAAATFCLFNFRTIAVSSETVSHNGVSRDNTPPG